jgi:hypothetical protein
MATLFPSLTVAAGGWVDHNSGGTNLHTPLADDSASTWGQSPLNPVNATLRLGFGTFSRALTDDISVEVDAIQVGTGTISGLTVEWRESGTLRASRYVEPDALVVGNSTRWEFVLKPEERSTFGTNVSLEMRLIANGGARRIRVTRLRVYAGQLVGGQVVHQLQPGQWAYDEDTKRLYIRCIGDLNPGLQKIQVFDWRFGMEEILLVTVAGVLVGRLCRHFSWTGDPTGTDINACRGGSVSYDASRVVFGSNWGGGAVGVYAVMTDPNA